MTPFIFMEVVTGFWRRFRGPGGRENPTLSFICESPDYQGKLSPLFERSRRFRLSVKNAGEVNGEASCRAALRGTEMSRVFPHNDGLNLPECSEGHGGES